MLAFGAQVHAQSVQIDSEISTPVETGAADNGAPADIEITTDGSIVIEENDGVVAVTINTDNSVTNNGAIQINESDNATGILIEAGRAGNIDGLGDISLLEDYEREDDDEDDDLDGPFAIGSNRTGLLLQAGGTHTGDITFETGASIAVEGNDSHGILLQSELDGALTLDGSVSVLGDNARAIYAEQNITGDVLISSAIDARGENAQTLDFEGDIGGALTIESVVTSSGFASTTLSNYIAPINIDDDTPEIADRIDAEDLADNSGGVAVRGSVTNGILINGNVDTFISEEDAEDETKDTIEDFDENRSTGSITSTGSGIALLIAAEDQDLIIGPVVETVRDTLDDDEDDDFTETLATFDYTQGLINRGVITANGLNIGFDAAALRIEGASDGSATATISGGMANHGTIQATAYNAEATAAAFGSGADIGTLENSGAISALTYAVTTEAATAVLIEEGALLDTLLNEQGTITATSVGVSGTATAIDDQSGTLTDIVNKGSISATLSSDGSETEETGRAIAIDLSSHDATTGATIIQERATPVDDVNGDDVIDSNDVDTPRIVGDVLFGAGDDLFQVSAGTVTGDVDFGAGDAAFELVGSQASGAVAFANGNHNLTLNNADLIGDVSFESAAAQFSLLNGSSFTGLIDSDGSSLDLLVTSSDLALESGNRTQLDSLSVDGASSLIVGIDPLNADGAIFTVAGAAELGADVTITPVLDSIARDPFTQVIISAQSLAFDGTLDVSDVDSIPYIYNLELSQSDSDLSLFFDLKTAEELGLDSNQTNAYEPLIDVFVEDVDFGAAIATLDDEDAFHQVYDLLLPQRTNASQRFLSTQWSAAYGAMNDHLGLLNQTDRDQVSFWVQEYFYSIDEESTVQSPGYNGDGFGVAAGFDSALGPIDRVGIMGTVASGSFEEKTGGYNPVSTSTFGLGLYAMQALGPIELRAAGQVSKVDFSSNRDFDVDELIYAINGHWTGQSQSLSVSAVSEFSLGWVYLRPELTADWFAMSQDAYTETGSSSTDSLYASVGEVDTDELSASGSLVLGRQVNFGGGIVRTEVSAGYQTTASATPYSASVSFASSDNIFDLTAPEDSANAALFGVAIAGEGGLLSTKVGYDVKVSDDAVSHILGGTIRVKF